MSALGWVEGGDVAGRFVGQMSSRSILLVINSEVITDYSAQMKATRVRISSVLWFRTGPESYRLREETRAKWVRWMA